ncbi:YfbM family protein [Streptomyces sp. HD]|uniref:YfbM family protein n=1 Tax=Streptomyces sp. HD TaxID=3020892 RepID=UPI00232C41C2|nr:YfbM family protein [Streptomyces sp. HD]MDC0767032.1 YfbM family protein [Streptomyces sp. HD]
MGMYISFTAATTEELDRAVKDPSWADEYVYDLYDSDDDPIPNRPDVGLDKAWAGLQFLLDETDVELEFMMDGFVIVEEGTLFGYSVKDVETVARQLRATPWERLAEHYDPERMVKDDVYPRTWDVHDGSLEWLRSTYDELVEFFGESADRGLGAFMTFSF